MIEDMIHQASARSSRHKFSLKTNQTTRVGVRYLADGSKERYAKRSGASMGQVAPPRANYAKKSS